jgi:hypothetical protein
LLDVYTLNCVGVNYESNVIVRGCPGENNGSTEGIEWVQDGTYQLVSVYGSNGDGGGTGGAGVILTSQGEPGLDATISTYTSVYGQWAFR